MHRIDSKLGMLGVRGFPQRDEQIGHKAFPQSEGQLHPLTRRMLQCLSLDRTRVCYDLFAIACASMHSEHCMGFREL